MIERETKSVYKHEILKELNERGIDNPSADDVFNHLLGDYYKDRYSDYTLRKYKSFNQTPAQRINMMWVLPIYALTVAPFMFIKTGDTGVKRESRLGRLIGYLIGWQ